MITLKELSVHGTDVKKSRFIAQAVRVDNSDQAENEIKKLADREASHNCWAYRIGSRYRFSDDGEPGGSAGRPILMAIDGQGLDHVLIVVTRHFGGIKLGVGGLARAYGGTASECLRQALKIRILPAVDLEITVPFEFTSQVYALLAEFEETRLSESFDEKGPRLHLRLRQDQVDSLRTRVKDITKGQGTVLVQSSSSQD